MIQEKKYICPLAIVIEFLDLDIITASNGEGLGEENLDDLP